MELILSLAQLFIVNWWKNVFTLHTSRKDPTDTVTALLHLDDLTLVLILI